MKTTEECMRIAASGGGLDLRSARKTTEEYMRIAAAAAGKGSQIIINGTGRTTEDCMRIAASGRGCVMFVLE